MSYRDISYIGLQTQGASYSERTCWVSGEAERTWHWHNPTALHSLRSLDNLQEATLVLSKNKNNKY